MNDPTRPVVERMEQRQLLSAALGVSSSLMVFNAVENSSPGATETLTLTDTGTSSLTLGNGAFSIANDSSSATQDAADFTLLNAGSAPATLSPGATFGLEIDYKSTAVETNKAILEISSNAPASPTTDVNLHGIGTAGLGGSNQPSLATILQAYDIPTYVGEGLDDANAATDSVYPTPPDSSSQEVALQRMVKAGAGPVTIDVLASFVASGFAKSYVLGTYTPGDPTGLNQLFYTTSTQNQTTYVQPQGSTSFDPGNSQFGFYFISNVQSAGRVGYTEDTLNTWDTTVPRKFRFFPMEEPNGTVVPNTYIMTSTEWNAPAGYDFTNMVAIISNIKAAPGAPNGPVLGLENENAVAGSSTMVFNRISGTNPSVGDQVHNTGVEKITNSGDEPLIISSYSLTSGWILVSPPSFPVTIAAGGSLALTIQFTLSSEPTVPYNETNTTLYPSGGGVKDGTLVLHSNDPNNATATVNLAGWYQYHSENNNEPSLQSIVNLLFGWDTNINSTPIADLTESLSTNNSSPTYYGQEVVSGYWQEADPNQSVSVQQIAGYHVEGQVSTTYWFAQGSTTYNELFETASTDGQTLFPYAINTSTPAAATFSTSGVFGFRADNEFSPDALNTTLPTGGGHHFRFYPVLTSSGSLVPNTYIMALDYGDAGENFDFQDDVWLISNIQPAQTRTVSPPQTTAAPPAPVDFNAATTTSGNLLQWAPVTDSNLTGYDVYRSNSATGTYTLLTSSPIAATSYVDTTAPATGTSYYELTTVDSVLGPSLAVSSSITNITGNGTFTAGDPVAASETASTLVSTPVSINVVAGASDNSNGTLLPGTVVVITAPADGTTSVNASTGVITYTPNAGFTGTDSFQYTIGDNTNTTSAPATVTIAVSSIPVGEPVAENLSFNVEESTALDFDLAASATDNSSATIVPTSVAITQAPLHGTAVVNPATGDILYTPDTGYLGTDSLLYTIADTLSAVSQPAIVSLTVSTTAPQTGPVAGNATATATNSGGATTIGVLSSVTNSSGTLEPSSVQITTQPLHGTATVDTSNGTINYTSAAGYVGSDTLQYTVANSQGLVSNSATVSLSVGVAITNPKSKSLAFTDASGSKVTVTLTGAGVATLFFNGSGTASTLRNGSIAVTGTGLAVSSLSVTGTTIASSLTISRKGNSFTPVGGITVTGAIGKITAPTTALTGNLDVYGAIGTIEFASISNSAVTIGSAESRTSALTLSTGNITNSTVVSQSPIKSIKATQWISTAAQGSLTAPSISSLITTGNFEAGISASGGSPFSLNTVRIGGQAGGDPWSVTGATNSIIVGSIATGFTGAFSSSINSFTIKSGGFAGTLGAGTIRSLSITGNDTGHVTAGSITTARIAGQLNAATLTLTGSGSTLGHLTVTGATISSTISTSGNIGSITTAGITGSSIDAGVATGISLPTTAGDFTASDTIWSFTVTGRGTFASSNIAAQTIGSLSLGTVATNNNAVPFGIAAAALGSLSATLTPGGVFHPGRNFLQSEIGLATYISDKAITLGDLAIRLGL